LFEPVLTIREEAAQEPNGPWYWVESTAPLHVDGAPCSAQPDLEERIRRIAERLAGMEDPHLAIRVHGYNNEVKAVRSRAEEAWSFLQRENLTDPNIAWIAYRWPSEKLGLPLMTSIRSMNSLAALTWFLSAICFAWTWWRTGAPAYGGVAVVSMLLLLIGLRVSVYYRDHYRASHHGVLDLVELIRKLDFNLRALHEAGQLKKRVRLSFIGHSMGGFVVTNAVRMLSDVFDRAHFRFLKEAGSETPPSKNPYPYDIGSSLTLYRLVLVSPDIPSETLMTGRTNFLAPSLRRFPECYLFSNGGDAVLSLISTTANYFVFPNRLSRSGWRLGNVRVESGGPFGILSQPADDQACLESIWINRYSLRQLQADTKGTSILPGTHGEHSASYFTFVDCASFSPFGRPALSYTKGGGRIGFFHSAGLLFQYLLFNPIGKKKDVHSGYFDFDPTRRLIYGIAAFGRLELDARSAPEMKSAALMERTRVKYLPATFVRPFSSGPIEA
jgi:hypothetical protein